MSDENKDTEVSELKKTVTSLATSVGELTKSVGTIATSLQTTNHNSAVEEEFRVAASVGKVVPDGLKKKDDAGKYKHDAETVKDIMASIPVTVATQFTTNGAPVQTQASKDQEADRDKAICASMGISKEAWDKGHGLIAGSAHGEAQKLVTAA